ncbi:MAG: MATE family efflux transporter [Bacteroidaceae bacterium]
MSDTSSNNKRIAKNTLLLYVRMLFLMAISLFTSRVILATLGVEDYGIYNVVGGVVAMFGFINSSMSSATQRYITFALGKGDKERQQTVFSTSLQIHALIAFVIVVLGETVGLWFLYNKMHIPVERMDAAFWVLQCSLASTVIMIVSVPYNAVIVAHEKMSAFAYITIFEVVLKLAIVYLLLVFSFDKLIIYSILILIVQLSIRFCYSAYCHRHFLETKYKHVWDKNLFMEMTSFAGWSFWGNLAGVLYTQGLNMMLNIFFGPVVNAARAVAVQVQHAIQQFVSNFQMALNPQITKTYAKGKMNQMHSLMFRSARFSFLLLFFISLPVILETEFILSVWLKQVPDDAVIFTQIMICISLIYTTANPCVIANQATGKVKVYQMVVGGILLMILPISYIVLKLGAPAYSVFLVHFFVESVAQFSRMYMLRKLIDLPMWQYMKNIYIPIATTVAVAIILPIIVRMQVEEGWLRFFAVGFTCILSVGLSAFFIGFTKNERVFFWDKGLRLLKIRQ